MKSKKKKTEKIKRVGSAPSISEMARRHSIKAVQKLVALVDSENERVALSAAQTVLDRAIGKVTQGMSMRGADGGLVVKIIRFNQERPDE